MKGASVSRTTNYTSQADNDVVSFDTEEYDTSGIWAAGSPSRLTIPAALNGYYAQFNAMAIWEGSTGGTYRELKIFKNGDTSNPWAVSQVAPANGNIGVHLVSRWIPVATGDYFELCLRSGSDQTALAATYYSIYFAVALLPAT